MPSLAKNIELDKTPVNEPRIRNIFHIHSVVVEIKADLGLDTYLRVRWSKGYVERGVYIPTAHYQNTLAGQDVRDVFKKPTTGSDMYTELKLAIRELLVNRKLIQNV